MGDMFRSEKMVLCQMFIQPEAAYASVAELGTIGCVQFRDLNGDVNAFQRKFVTEVRRSDELERKLRYIEKEISKDGLKLPKIDEKDEPHPPNPREIIDLEAHVESIESEIRELSANEVNLKANYLGMNELKLVLENTVGFFSDQEVMNLDTNRFVGGDDPSIYNQPRGQLGFVAGVIKLERFFAFERMLWRITRGNVFVKRSDLSDLCDDLETGQPTLKTVFVAFFQGEQLKQRITKVCAGFHAALYPCPSAHSERLDMIRDVSVRLEDLKLVLNQTADHRNRVLVAASTNLPAWSIMAKKMKAIYHTLNLFNMDVSAKCLIGEGWVPTRDLPVVQRALAAGSTTVESAIPSFLNVIQTNEQAPTYTRTNKFTRGFQNLIDSYGVASYREVNPALYTCITFPFLFGVMFGDLGHGLILLLVSLWMVIGEKKLSKVEGEIFNLFFVGRYIILLMACFSMYSGFIYNDLFSKSMNIFGSAWSINYNTTTVLTNPSLQLNPTYDVDDVYPLGLDPIWQLADNKIIFLNTFKMKLSIIFGVIHMIFGLSMSVVNFNYFKHRMHIILEFVPQLLFLLLLFGYMVFMMFFKFVKYSAKSDEQALTPGCAPSILILFINMMLFGSTPPQDGCDEFLFEGEKQLEMYFVIIAVVCIPWMLLGKPLYILATKKKDKPVEHHFDANHTNGTDLENGKTTELSTIPVPIVAPAPSGGHGEKEPEDEIFILQSIHTIEYVLSTISHTASYLRLWALSLAHAQLSEVLWTMIMSIGLKNSSFVGSIMLFFIFAIWASLTIGILVLIEGLSAFLHTLRLHWVEFMSKFYEGLGFPFQPFSFKTILEEEEDE